MSLPERGRTDLPTNQTLDYCENCGANSPHAVSIELRETGNEADKQRCRSPFRVASCVDCGEETVERASSI